MRTVTSKLKSMVGCHLESVEQEALAQWLDSNGFVWVHVPNEIPSANGKVNYGWLAAMRKRGLKPSFPDNLIFGVATKRGIFPLQIAIELKRVKGGRIKPEQKAWIEWLERFGWKAAVCHGARAAMEFIKKEVDGELPI